MQINTAFIFAGGKGTRLKELTTEIPKPMIEIIDKPLILHLINYFRSYQVNEIYILTGYKHEFIEEYFKTNYTKIKKNIFKIDDSCNVNLIYTGLNSLTGKRLKKALEKVEVDNFYLTYGDGLSDVNLFKLSNQYFNKNKIGIVTAVRPPARFGSLDIKNNTVVSFGEKKQTDEGWINGGFFILNRKILSYLSKDNEPFEGKPLELLSSNKQLEAYLHNGYWQCVDTIREKELLEDSIRSRKLIING